jgi:predicted DNA-binding transcriptional regulator AlpA
MLTSIKFLKETEVSSLISKSVAWLQRARWEGGGIPYHKIGRSVRYAENEVLEWLEKNAPKCKSTSEYSKRGCENA